MKNPATRTRPNGSVRCAIYTRKSSEEGLEQEFNSLQANRVRDRGHNERRPSDLCLGERLQNGHG